MSSLQGFCACMHGRDLCDFMDMGSGLQGLCTCMHVEYRYCFCHSLIVYCVYHHDTSNMAVLLGSHGVYQAWKANNVDMHHAWHNMVSHGSSSLTDYWCVCVSGTASIAIPCGIKGGCLCMPTATMIFCIGFMFDLVSGSPFWP